MSEFGVIERGDQRDANPEANENGLQNHPINFTTPFPPPRTPLNTIPDPSQFSRDFQSDSKAKFESATAHHRLGRVLDKKVETWIHGSTPRGRGKVQLEPNSAQSTPARSVSKSFNNGGVLGVCSGNRLPQDVGVRGGGNLSKVYRGVSIAPAEPSIELVAPHFELVEDPSFWTDHNVQVMIRIRPLSSTERALQGYNRCLRQESANTLTWLGHPETRFTFDNIACEMISQEKLFNVAGLPMVENCMSGYNSCMFAYGQTGSGKTYTMMGEILDMDGELNKDCGITPRIFEYLFMRIRAEEEHRRDEKLKYSCKCSFLEIYNEQITDLLEPSSTNLQLREDTRKGVHVENLTEFEVTTVKDVLQLLLKGATNRKMAATNMNSESSRSHSVFTCTVESRWVIDSMTHLRFGRLNLVDLAGSERQKSSGAEGERLKEAANINKSLSTLGLVIMTLVDVAHGKIRHVPYRDSRLTFLLQDSLGGNSKTTIIANISPSICSANETLSTLKFAQRAKFIQNNAKVNEDASGDVVTLQRQIQQLKDQLTFLLKNQDFSRSQSLSLPSFEQSQLDDICDLNDSSRKENTSGHQNITSISVKETRCNRATLVGALRREKMAEIAVRRLEAEIEQMSRLVHQYEEDAQRSKMILRFREEKIKRLELLTDGLISTDEYLVEENSALSKEIQLIEARLDKNPELIRFAMENIRLLEQLRVFQDFYERGEKETLLAEVSELRDQLTEVLEANHEQLGSTLSLEKNQDIVQELEDCRGNLDRCLEINVKLTREVDELRKELNKHINCSRASFDIVADALSMDAETTKETEKQAVEMLSAKADSEDEVVSCWKVEADVLQTKNDQKMGHIFTAQHNDTQKELLDAKSLIEALKYKKLHLIEELDTLQKKNSQCMELWRNKDLKEIESIMKPSNSGPSEMHQKVEDLHHQEGDLLMEHTGKVTMSCLQAKLDKMTMDLEEARILNRQYQDDQQLQLFHEKEAEQVRRQVEEETAKTILHLQELVMLQEELQEKLNALAEENIKLRNIVTTREGEMRMLSEKWEKATLELTSFIIDGCRSLEDASEQIESIKNSFPESEDWISEHVDRAAKIIAEREKTIAQLQMSLEDAQKMGLEMQLNLSSLKGATLAMTELQQLETDENTKEAIQLRERLSDKILTIQELHDKLKIKENQMNEAEKCATAAFEAAKRLTDLRSDVQNAGEIPDPESLFVEFDEYRISDVISELDAQAREAIKLHVEMVRRRIFETENAINVSYMDTGNHLSALISGILDTFFTFLKLIMNLIVGTPMKKKLMEFKEQNIEAQHDKVMHQVRSGLCVMNDRLISISKHIDAAFSAQVCSGMVGNIAKIDTLSSVQLMPCSGLSHENIFPKGVDETSSYSYNSGSTEKLSEMSDIDSIHSASTITIRDLKNSDNPKENFICCTGAILGLREEMESTFNSFLKIHLQLTKLVHDGNSLNYFGTKCFHESNAHKHQDLANADDKEKINQPSVLDVARKLQSLHLPAEEAEADCGITREMLHLKLNDVRLVADEKVKTACSFFHKFEEAHATLKEADLMLNELLKANEDAKHMTDQWKQAGEELMIDKTLLIEEVQQLKSSISLKEREYDVLQDQLQSSLLEVANSVSSLEGSFLQMQIDVDERFMILHSDVFSLGQDLLNCIHSLRSSLEKMWSEILEKGFTLFVLHKCYTESCCEKLSGPNSDSGFAQGGLKEFDSVNNNVGKEHMIIKEGSHMIRVGNIKEETKDNRLMLQSLSNPGDVLDAKNALGTVATLHEEAVGRIPDSVISENLSLQRELARKDVLLKGLLFDLRLLQESTSNVKDFKDKTELMFQALTTSQHELSVKAAQLDDILLQHRKLEAQLADKEVALSISNSKLAHANETLDMLSKKNAELRIILEDVYAKQASTEEQLEEKKEAIKGLEKEILCVAFSVEERVVSSIQAMECELSRVILERDRLREEVASLNDKLEMANALADENEAMAVEARQESEASKVYAEQKEEEAKILENSVEELEHTIDVLEKKVHEMGKEVERHHLTRDNLELELQDLRLRMVTVESVTESIDVEGSDVDQPVEDDSSRLREGRKWDLLELRKQIRILEREKADQAKEIKECRDYISELVLHAEAQASQYQQKYKALEAMVREVQRDPSTSTCATSALDKTEKNSTRTRGSSSPFRCLTNLVQQMNLEKDQDLSVARLRIEELEALASSRQKEVCRLNARLAATENMTHDVIRDLLGVKLDMTNYANLIDQYHVQRLIEEAQQRSEESSAKDQEIVKLRKEINELVAERQSCVDEISRRQADLLESELMVEQLQYRDQMLTAQNEMLKVDKANLKRKITEMDEMVKKHSRLQRIQPRILQPLNIKDNIRLRAGNDELSIRLTNSEKLLSRVNDELAQYRTSDGIDPYNKSIEGQRVRNK